MKFDPKAPLTEQQINELNDDDLFEYLDDKSKYLSNFTKPLDTKHAKVFLVASKNSPITNEDLKVISKLAKRSNIF